MNNKMTREQVEAAATALIAGEPRVREAWLGRAAFLMKHLRISPFIANSVSVANVVEPVDFLNPRNAYWDG